MLSNFIPVTLQPNKGSTKQTMVIATQWPDRYRLVFSPQAVFTAIKWRLTCSANEQRTLLWALGSVHRCNNILLEMTERGSVHRRQFVSAHKSVVCSLTGNTHSVP